jgi:Ca2+-transporting ATPase
VKVLIPLFPAFVLNDFHLQAKYAFHWITCLLHWYSECLYLWQGAVETLLERSSHIQLKDGSVVPLDEKAKKTVLASLHEMSTKALRCLGFAYKEDLAEFATYDGENHPAHKLLLDPANYAAIETDLIFAGLVGLRVR